MFEAELQTERGHQETEEHGAAVAHEDFGRLEIPAQEAGGAAQNCCGEGRDQCLTVEVRDHRKKDRSHCCDARAQAVHVIEDAEGCGDADDPKDGKDRVKRISRASGNESLKYLSVNSAGEKNSGSEGHRDEQFDLMMQPALVIEEADRRNERRARYDAEALRARRAVEREQNREHDRPPHCESAQERDWLQVYVARSG